MNRINNLKLFKLINTEHIDFMNAVDGLIRKYHAADLGIDDLYPQFQDALVKENDASRIAGSSIQSDTVEQLDRMRDRTWSAIVARVKATQKSPFGDEAASAGIIRDIITSTGDVRNLSFPEETKAIDDLCNLLVNGENSMHLEKIGITSWFRELIRQNDEFRDAFQKRQSGTDANDNGNLKESRQTIDPQFELIVERINATLILTIAKPAATGFMNELNSIIGSYKTAIAARTPIDQQ